MTDAEFLLWLKNGARQSVILAELQYAYDVAGAPQTGTMYFSDAPYATGSAESPSSTAYRDVIVATPGFSRAIDRASLGGRARFSVGSLELDNADGGLDFLLDRIIDGHEASFLLGAAGWARADFREIFAATMEAIRATETRLTISLRDNGALLDKRVSGLAIGGAEAAAGARRQLIFGVPSRVEAVLSDRSALRYFIGSDLIGAEVIVYDAGLQIGRSRAVGMTPWVLFDPNSEGAAPLVVNADTDTLITEFSHGLTTEDVVYYLRLTSGVDPFSNPPFVSGSYYWVRNATATTFQLSTTRTGSVIDFISGTYSGTMELRYSGMRPNDDGSIDLAHSPSGLVTADYIWPPSAGYTEPLTRTVFTSIIDHFVTVEAGFPSVDYAGAHPSADNLAAESDPVDGGDPFVGLVIGEPTSAMDVLDELVSCIQGFWSITRTGTLQYGRVLPNGALTFDTPTYTIADDDVVRRSITLDRQPPQYSRFSCIYDKNWTPQQSGFAGAVEDWYIAYASEPGRVAVGTAESGTSYATAPSRYHKTLTESPLVDTLLMGSQSASFWLSRARAKWAPHNEIITLQTHLGFYLLELGDVVTLDIGALGLINVTAQVIGIDVALTESRMTLTLIRKRIPIHPAFSIDVSWAELEAPT